MLNCGGNEFNGFGVVYGGLDENNAVTQFLALPSGGGAGSAKTLIHDTGGYNLMTVETGNNTKTTNFWVDLPAIDAMDVAGDANDVILWQSNPHGCTLYKINNLGATASTGELTLIALN